MIPPGLAVRMLLASVLMTTQAPARAIGITLASQIREVRGTATIAREGQKIAATQSEPLYPGDELRVPTGGTLVLWLQSGATLKLNENTVIRVSESTTESSQIRLLEGGLFLHLDKATPSRFGLEAGPVRLNAQGTDFFASWDGQAKRDLWLHVREGAVGIEPNKIEVTAGLGVKISEGRPGPLARFRWAEGLNWSLDPSEGELMNSTPRWTE